MVKDSRASGTDYTIVTCDRYSAPLHSRLLALILLLLLLLELIAVMEI